MSLPLLTNRHSKRVAQAFMPEESLFDPSSTPHPACATKDLNHFSFLFSVLSVSSVVK
jgi:hypothetical protein